MANRFPQTPDITVHDPLAEFLGAGDGIFTYRFDDVVKLSGHACPTVAGAFLMTIHALNALYRDELPQRGDVEITVYGAQDEGVIGPITQVFTLLTGAAASNGFHGLAGRFTRSGLMDFVTGVEGPAPFVFERISTGERVGVSYDPSAIPAAAEMGSSLQGILQGNEDPALQQRFATAWKDRVLAILADEGVRTVSVDQLP